MLEYLAVASLFSVLGVMPFRFGYWLSGALGRVLYLMVPRRRRLALENLRQAFRDSQSEREIRALAWKSCCSVLMTYFEAIKLSKSMEHGCGERLIRQSNRNVDRQLQKAREIHEKAGGCIFVTPHLGNWEVFPDVAALAGIPLVIIVRNYRNAYLHNLFHKYRLASGQAFVLNHNAMIKLQQALHNGKSVGMLPDQSTRKGISVTYFGRPALTTPIPAILAITYMRPIVVVACCRRSPDFHFDGFVSEPIWPQVSQSEKAEVYRLTQEMTQAMEVIIRQYPEQYLWMHNRWKRYRAQQEVAW